MEFIRSYNTCYFNGNETSQIVVMTDKGYQIFDDSNFYLDKVERHGGQDFKTELKDIKRGNKTLFKGANKMPVIKNRVIPKQSIPYDLRNRDRYYGDGDWLFLWCDDFEIIDTNENVEQKYTGIDREYHFNIQGYKFIGKKYTSKVNLKQANEEVFSNLSEHIASYNYKSHREYLEAQVYLLDKITDNSVSIKKGEISEDRWGEKKQEFIVAINGEDDFRMERIDLNRQVEIDSFYKKYDANTIMRDYDNAWLA